jgi:Xaa-Pro aminopeptidase
MLTVTANIGYGMTKQMLRGLKGRSLGSYHSRYTKFMILLSEYIERRRNAIQAHPNTVIVLTAHHAVQHDRDSAAAFIQEANFAYLTGIHEQGWKVIIAPNYEALGAPSVDAVHQLFDGSLSTEEAQTISGINTILAESAFEDKLKELAQHYETVATIGVDPYEKYYDFETNPAPKALRRRLKKQFTTVLDIRPSLQRLRAIKSPAEIVEIEAAIAATIPAFTTIRTQIDQYSHEYQIEADLSRAFRYDGAQGHAYAPIVASGANACTLHYGKNAALLPPNSFVLIDAGAKMNGYAADITRTYAIGAPTDRMLQIYAAVESAHHSIITLLRPGLTLREYRDRVDEIMKEALRSVELLQSDDDYRRYFPHAISHGLGLNVHDSLGGYEAFQPGMVLTVEPGIYIPEEAIGVRIEDDILITESGHRNLSASLPTSL